MFSCIWISKKSYRSLVGTPIAFSITQNKLKMKKKWGFKLERFEVFFQKISNKISQFWILRLNSFLIALLHLKFKEVLKIVSWCTHSFLNHSKRTYNEKKMGFQIKKVQSFFSKHLKQNITILEFEIKIFKFLFIYFALENKKDIVDC